MDWAVEEEQRVHLHLKGSAEGSMEGILCTLDHERGELINP